MPTNEKIRIPTVLLAPFAAFAFVAFPLGSALAARPPLATPVAPEVAWNERVELPAVPGAEAASVRFRLTLPGGDVTVLDGAPLLATGDAIVFDLPDPPTSPPAIDAESYRHRATLDVRVLGAEGDVVAQARYRPYGAVVAGHVNALLERASCPEEGEVLLDMLVARSATAPEALCFVTLDVGPQSLARAADRLRRLPDAVAVDAEAVFSADGYHRYAVSYDPTCEQIAAVLDPVAQGFDQLDDAAIRAAVDADAAHAAGIDGSGVTVWLIGGGIGPAGSNPPGVDFVEPGTAPTDAYRCDLDGDGSDDLLGHDSVAAAIVRTVAPGAELRALRICSDEGVCPSGLLATALMHVLERARSPSVVNVSLGGPRPDATLFALLREPGFRDLSAFLFVASAGNAGVPVEHYPGSYSPLSDPPGSLPNVLSVGAVGQQGGIWAPAPFTTGGNFDIVAPGVNLCPSGVRGRCVPGAPSPDGLGLSGTSFAAPHVAGVAALYAQAQPGSDLRRLLLGARQQGRVWYR